MYFLAKDWDNDKGRLDYLQRLDGLCVGCGEGRQDLGGGVSLRSPVGPEKRTVAKESEVSSSRSLMKDKLMSLRFFACEMSLNVFCAEESPLSVEGLPSLAVPVVIWVFPHTRFSTCPS